VLDKGNPEAVVEARIARRGIAGLTLAQAIAETGWTKESIESRLAEAILGKRVLRFGDLLAHRPSVETLKAAMVRLVDEFHQKNPLVPGMGRSALEESSNASPVLLAAVLDLLVKEKRLALSGEVVHLPGRGVVMKDDEAESKKTIEDAFASAGLQVPALYQVIAGLKVDKVRAQKIVTLLLRDKVLVKISDELVFHHTALASLRNKLAAYKTKSAKIDVAQFKDMTGVSRKYAIPLLEYLDRERVTKRVGDAREIL